MSAPIYATTEDLKTYCAPDAVPTGINDRSLREASAQVDQMLLTAIYRVGPDQHPTDPMVAEALMHATCAQALHVAEYGDEVEIRELGIPVSLGPLSIGGRRGTSGGTAADVPVWSPKAIAFLVAEQLIVGPVIT